MLAYADIFTDYAPEPDVDPVLRPVKPRVLTVEEWQASDGPDYRGIYAWRLRRLAQMKAGPVDPDTGIPWATIGALEYYKTHKLEFILHWCDTYDPRRRTMKWMPFIMFTRQWEFLQFLYECYEQGEHGLVEKCRDAGLTWLCVSFSVVEWLFTPNVAIGLGSRKQELVDKIGDASSIFEKIRMQIRRLPKVFQPKGFKPERDLSFMRILNSATGAAITGEVGDNIGRGGRTSIYFKDEAQPLTAGILTPSGWQTMGDMHVGSTVIGADGKPRYVGHINDCGVHPVYKIDFSDGTSTECSENHLWTIDKVLGKRERLTLRTSEMIETFKYRSPGGQTIFRYRAPVCQPVEFAQGEPLPLHPWVVGALLGDGKIGSGCPIFTTNDPENVVRFAGYIPEGTTLRFDGKYGWRFVDSGNRYNKSSRARNTIKAAGIAGMRSETKRIPKLYKFASVEDRLQLLQGLMDTDGSASGGVASFHTCSIVLANDVRFIVQSLGGTATMNVKPDHRGYRDMYVIHMTIPNMSPFALARKKDALRIRKHLCDKTIVNIEYVRDDVVRCITVDDGLYLTDHCIVTHNSAHYERPELIEAALGDNTNVQIDVSSVNGLGNVFHRRREAGEDWAPGKTIETGKVRVFVFDRRDHPMKTDAWYERRRVKAMSEGLEHVFKQEVDRDYSGAVVGTIIPREWIVAAIDADIKLAHWTDDRGRPIDFWSGGRMSALDIADSEEGDTNALAGRKGIVLDQCQEWYERDTGVTTRRAINELLPFKPIECQYDSVGMGSAVKAEYNRLTKDDDPSTGKPLLKASDIRMVPWSAGDGVLNPMFRVIEDDNESEFNKDFFHNLKAQAWWALKMRFWRTFQAVTLGIRYDPSLLIILDGRLPNIRQIEKELAQPTMTKSLASLKMIVNKKPDGTKSPNLADAIVMCYFPVPLDNPTAVFGAYGIGNR